jgi:hypothetical protein
MGTEQVRERLRERIKRGASFEELENVIRLTRGLRERERWELWNWAWRYDPAEQGVRARLLNWLRWPVTPNGHR